MKNQTIKEQMKKIKGVQEKFNISKDTIDTYQNIYKQYLKYLNKEDAYYNSNLYQEFLLNHYNLDITKDNSREKTWIDNLYRSKELLEDLDSYITKLNKRVVINNQKDLLTDEYQKLLNKYEYYCLEVRTNSIHTVSVKKNYISNILAYFITNDITDIKDVNENVINSFINQSVNKGNRSKSRYFYVLRDFLIFLYSEDILLYNYSYLIPSIKRIANKRIPTYIKQDKVKELLDVIPRERKIDKRDYAIVLMASELGIRISDILNLKFANIDWEKKTISFNQIKTNKLNILPLSNELGWAIIDYIKNCRPITDSKYIFVRHIPPYDKLMRFNSFNKYFNKADIEINDDNKKGIHNLRHSLATRMLENEIPIDIIAPILGHSTIESTKTYLKVDINKLKSIGLDVK